MPRSSIIAASILAAGLVGSAALVAGPLSPPAGPVASSYKTLSEVEPRIPIGDATTPGDNDATPSRFKITQPGSYYLTGNLQGVSGKIGIEIAASNVTVDLSGFELAGVAGSLDGIASTVSALRNVAVLNGAITGWGGDGVDLVASAITGGRVHAVQASGNGGRGIRVAQAFVVSDSVAIGNGTGGFFGSIACTFTSCAARINTGVGFDSGISAAHVNCTSHGNTGFGFQVDLASTLTGCVATSNTSTGIASSNSVSLLNCVASANDGDGIAAAIGSRITSCTAASNGGRGISAPTGSVIVDSSATFNTLSGISVGQNCLVRGNSCVGNGSGAGDGAGILATSSDNRIEGNNCVDNDRGIDVNSAGNIIVRNTCAGNVTNWDIVANNVVGPIFDRTAPGSAAILGNSAPDSTGSSHPSANFTY